MKFNTTYKQNIKLKDTIKTIDHIKKEIYSFYNQLFDLTEVIPPVFFHEKDNKIINFDRVTRNISFDLSSNKVATNVLTHSNWARSLLRKLNVEEKEGIIFLASTIWRDLPEDTSSNFVRDEVTVMFKINSENLDRKLSEITNQLYSLIHSFANEIFEQFKVKNIYPNNPEVITSQQLENEFPDIKSDAQETEFLFKHDAMILREPGVTLFSGHHHTFIPPQIYDLKRFNQIILKDRINTRSVRVASIGILSSGIQMSDQLALYGMTEISANPFYKDLMKDKDKYIEIKINIPRLALALLAKGHIAEVQPEIFSDEVKNILERHSVQKY